MRVRRLIKEIIVGEPQRLLTLTVRTGTCATPDLQARLMAESFRTLMKWVREIWHEHDHQWFVVFEAHKSGWPHMHVALRGCYLPWWWLSAAWEALTGSPGVDIRKIYDVKDCAGYVAKYMGKDSHRFGTCKRYWRSLGWKLHPDDGYEPDERFGSRWFIVVKPFGDLLEDWCHRYKHVWLEYDQIVTGPDPPEDVKRFRELIKNAG